jgi:hypothetical protein
MSDGSGLICLCYTGEVWYISLDGLALENNREGRRGLNVGVSGARVFGGALTGASEGVVEATGPVERTALDLDRVRT